MGRPFLPRSIGDVRPAGTAAVGCRGELNVRPAGTAAVGCRGELNVRPAGTAAVVCKGDLSCPDLSGMFARPDPESQRDSVLASLQRGHREGVQPDA